MTRWFKMLMLLALLTPIIGCEASGEVDVDDDDADVRLDVD